MSTASATIQKTQTRESVDRQKPPRPARDLLLLLGICLAVRLLWVFMIPISEAPDEGAHYWVIDFIRQHWALPQAKDVYANPSCAYYGALPPCGYALHVLTATIAGGLGVPLAARLGSVLSAMVMVWASWRIGQLLFAKARWMQLALPLVLIFHPQLAFVQSYSNNDATTAALASVALLQALTMLKQGLTMKRSFLFGVICGWLMLSKFSGYCLFPALGAAMIAAAFLHPGSKAKALRCLLMAVSTALVMSGWWFARNLQQFHDLTGVPTMVATWASAYHIQLGAALYAFPGVNHQPWRQAALASFWGLLGNLNRPLPDADYRIFGGFLTAAAFGLLCALKTQAKPAAQKDRLGLCCWVVLAACCLLAFTGLIFSSLASATAGGPPQGRYMFPAEIPFMALALSGLARLPYGLAKRSVAAFVLFCAGSWLYTTLMLLPVYGIALSPMRCALVHQLW